MTNVESMDYTHSHPSTLLATAVSRNFLRCIKTHHMSFLKTATIPTYYGIFIAIPRYIAMQLSIIPSIMTHSSLSYCLA